MSDTQTTDKPSAIPTIPLALIDHLPDAVIIVDAEGRITRANPRVAILFGYEPQALLGQPVEVLMPERFQQVHVMQRTGFLSKSSTRTMGAGLELYGRRSDSSEFPVDIMLSPIDGPEGKAVLAVVRDLTERLEADRQRQLAARNETLLREIHHRVKNNLQVILSLLSVQSENVRDPAARAVITESESRIRSVSLIHEKLYRSLKLGGIDFAEYVNDLCVHLFHSFGAGAKGVRFELDADGVWLGVDSAVPCGLIVNELVSNSLKHAFPDGRAGNVTVTMSTAGGRIELTVRDDGVGWPDTLDINTCESLGLQLVSLLTNQLGGEFDVLERRAGTALRIRFEELKYRERT
jgi:PAS domain S-box-containing protein